MGLELRASDEPDYDQEDKTGITHTHTHTHTHTFVVLLWQLRVCKYDRVELASMLLAARAAAVKQVLLYQ